MSEESELEYKTGSEPQFKVFEYLDYIEGDKPSETKTDRRSGFELTNGPYEGYKFIIHTVRIDEDENDGARLVYNYDLISDVETEVEKAQLENYIGDVALKVLYDYCTTKDQEEQ